MTINSPRDLSCAVIVGVRSDTKTVDQVWVQADGLMRGFGRTHRTSSVSNALYDACEVFGLSKVREFPIYRMDAAKDYRAALQRLVNSGHL